MNKNQIIAYAESQGGKFIGYYPISFPVYVVHVSYDSVDTDPFYPIRRALLKYTDEVDANLENLAYFSRLTGFDYELLKRAVFELKKEGMIMMDDTGRCMVSNDARRKYLIDGNRPTVKVTGSFLVDGKSLELLPEIIYSTQADIDYYDKKSNVAVHLPVDLAMSQAPAESIEQLLTKGEARELLKLESSVNNFEVLNLDKKFLKGAYVVFYIDRENNCRKDTVYMGVPISCKALGSVVGYSIDLAEIVKEESAGVWEFRANTGYNIANPKDMDKVSVIAQNDGWNALLSSRYNLGEATPITVETDKNDKRSIIVLSENMLNNSSNPISVINDALKGYIDFPIKPNGCVRIEVRNEIQQYTDFVIKVSTWQNQTEISARRFVESLSKEYPEWRRWLVKLRMFDALERIDCDRFILS